MTFGNQAFPGFSLLSLPQITTTSWPDSDHDGPFPSCPHLVSQRYLLSYKLTTFGEMLQFLSFFFCPSPFQPLTVGCVHLLSACLVQLPGNRSSLFVVSSCHVLHTLGDFSWGFHHVKQTPGQVLTCSREKEGHGVSNTESTSVRELCLGPSYAVWLAMGSMLRSQ